MTKKSAHGWLTNLSSLCGWLSVTLTFQINCSNNTYLSKLSKDEEDWAYFTHIFTRKTSSDLEFQIKSVFKNFHGNKEKWDENEE